MPFLASNAAQLQATKGRGISAVEAVIFNRTDLADGPWHSVWKNIENAVRAYGPEQVVFHFPVNDCNYVADVFVRQRVEEAWQRCGDTGCAGMVVHANQVFPFAHWQSNDIAQARLRVVDVLADVLRQTEPGPHSCWLGLENMPLMDNLGKEIDPTFVFPEDFDVLEGTQIGITWDHCHYSNALMNAQQALEGKQSKYWYPNLRQAGLLEFQMLESRIVHWHFSAFEGLANPETGATCREGFPPELSTLGEEPYAEILKEIMSRSTRKRLMTLEIQEDNYLCERWACPT